MRKSTFCAKKAKSPNFHFYTVINAQLNVIKTVRCKKFEKCKVIEFFEFEFISTGP